MIRAHEAARRGADEAWDAGLDVVDEFFAAHHRCHDPLMPDLPAGPHGVREHVDALLAAMPNAVVTVDEWIEGTDVVMARWTVVGTHTGELMGMPPSGRSATVSGTHVCRLEGGLIVETWVNYDVLDLLDQLGLVTLGIALGP